MCGCLFGVCRWGVWVGLEGVLCVCIHRRSWTLSPRLCSRKTDTANQGRPRSRPRSQDIIRQKVHAIQRIFAYGVGSPIYGRSNTKSTVRRLTVNVLIVNICSCGSTVV